MNGLSPTRLLRLLWRGGAGEEPGQWSKAWTQEGGRGGATAERRYRDTAIAMGGDETLWDRILHGGWRRRRRELARRLERIAAWRRVDARWRGREPGIGWPEELERGSMAMAMVAGLCARSKGQLWATPRRASDPGLAEAAVEAWEEVYATGRREAYVETGLWMEAMVERGFHPREASDGLQQAALEGRLRRWTEGSTPETRYPERRIQVLECFDDGPLVWAMPLDHPAILIDGRAGTSLRIAPATGRRAAGTDG